MPVDHLKVDEQEHRHVSLKDGMRMLIFLTEG